MKVGNGPPGGGDIGNLATDLGDRLKRQNLGWNRNGSCRHPLTEARVRRYRSCPVVEGKVGQCHLGQNQDDGEQRQFKNED